MDIIIILGLGEIELVDILGGIFIFAIIIIGVVSPCLAFFFRKTGFKSAWKTSSLLLLGILLLIITPIMAVSYYTEEKPLIDRMDKQYIVTKNELPKGETTKKIFVEIYKSGNSSTSGYRTVNYVINNYNVLAFKGKLKISAFYDGNKIGEKEVDLHLLSTEKGYDDFIEADKLKIDRHIWNNVEFKYEIQGKFI